MPGLFKCQEAANLYVMEPLPSLQTFTTPTVLRQLFDLKYETGVNQMVW